MPNGIVQDRTVTDEILSPVEVARELHCSQAHVLQPDSRPRRRCVGADGDRDGTQTSRAALRIGSVEKSE